MERFPATVLELVKRRGVGGAALIVLWATATGALFGGCDGLFRPATPEAPSVSDGVFVPLDYATPSKALETMAAGVGAKGHGNGKEAYLGALSDGSLGAPSFTATFDSEVARRHELGGRTVPQWNLALENSFYGFFVGLRSESYVWQWSINEVRGNDQGTDTGDSTLFRRYQVFLVGEDGNTQGLIAIGTADLHFKEVSSARWSLTLWEDGVEPSVGVDPLNPEERSLSARRLETQ